MSHQTDDKLLSRAEAAAYLQVSASSLARWASNKRGPSYYRLGRETRYYVSDLESFRASRRVVPAADC
mgnify:CR=1 FL=1